MAGRLGGAQPLKMQDNPTIYFVDLKACANEFVKLLTDNPDKIMDRVTELFKNAGEGVQMVNDLVALSAIVETLDPKKDMFSTSSALRGASILLLLALNNCVGMTRRLDNEAQENKH